MAVREFTVGSRPQHEWGWLVIVDFFLAGTGSGLFLVSLILGFPLGMAVAVGLVLLGAVLLLADLTRPSDAWRVLYRPQHSWLSRGTIGILVFALLAIIHIVYSVSQPTGWAAGSAVWLVAPGWEKALAVVAGMAAVFVALYPGFLLGSARPIPLWNNGFSPALFLVSALLSGLGTALLLPLNPTGQLWALPFLKSLGIGLIILQLVLLFSLLSVTQNETASASIRQLTRGNLSIQFYIGVLLLGMAIPLAILALSLVGTGSLALLSVTGILLLLGMFFLRYILVKAGKYVSAAS